MIYWCWCLWNLFHPCTAFTGTGKCRSLQCPTTKFHSGKSRPQKNFHQITLSESGRFQEIQCGLAQGKKMKECFLIRSCDLCPCHIQCHYRSIEEYVCNRNLLATLLPEMKSPKKVCQCMNSSSTECQGLVSLQSYLQTLRVCHVS